MDHLTALLRPYVSGLSLPPAIYNQIHTYVDLMLRWNARTNITAIRDPEQIVTRHFGESLFAASVLFSSAAPTEGVRLADVGSGAGLPGLPIKLAFPQIGLTLIESQNRKATFLREVLRALDLQEAEVFQGRAEQWRQTAEVVTLRAVENFASALPTSASLVTRPGRLCLLIGHRQVQLAAGALGRFVWDPPQPIPGSTQRVVLVGSNYNSQP